MLSRRGRGSAGFFPHPGRLLGGKPPPDSTAILTKTGGADVRHTKQRTGRARTFTNTHEQKRAQRKSYTRQDPGAAHARTHSGREMLQDGVTTAEGAETRTGDARPPERNGDTKGGATHTGQRHPRSRQKRSRHKRSWEWTHRRMPARPDRGTPRLLGVSPSRLECAGGRGMRIQRGYSHPRTDAPRGPS